jgi:hypothetical protein
MSTKTTPNATHREPLSETEALRVDLEQTRQHLADTVQELSRQLDVRRRIKETAGDTGRRLKTTAGQVGSRVKENAGDTGRRLKTTAGQVGSRVKENAGDTGRRLKTTAGQIGTRVKENAGDTSHRLKTTAGQIGTRVKDVPDQVKDLPAASLRHPKSTAAVGGAVALGVGAAAWMARRSK